MSLYGRYHDVRDRAYKVLIDYGIKSLPVNVVDLAKAANIKIYKDSDAKILKDHQMGLCAFVKGKWYIFYDDTMSLEDKRFTIAHEFGHIFLEHMLFVFCQDEFDCEGDADKFASYLLAPEAVLRDIDASTPEQISNTCKIGYTDAKYCSQRFVSEQSPFEQKLLNNFSKYIKENEAKPHSL